MEYMLNLRFADGTSEKSPCKVTEKNGISAVFADFRGTDRKICADHGADIRIDLPGLASYMADNRYSEFWCRPQFGHSFAEVPESTQALLYKMIDKSTASNV